MQTLLKKKGMSISRLSEVTGLSRPMLYRLKDDTAKYYKWDKLEAICEALNLKSMNELIEYVPDKQEGKE